MPAPLRQPPRVSPRGFTLVELLVVISIIALLISLLLPALGQARFQAMRTKSAANMKGLITGFFNYAADNRAAVPQSIHIYSWGEPPFAAYMNKAGYGPGPGPQCNLMPVFDGYGLRPLTPHVFSPNYSGIGKPGNEYPPISPTYWVSLGGYMYFPDYTLDMVPAASACAGPTRLDLGRPGNVIIQDWAGMFPTLLPTGLPYSTSMPSQMSTPRETGIGYYAEAAPAAVYAGCYDGTVRLQPGSTIQYVSYTPGSIYFIGHTQPQ